MLTKVLHTGVRVEDVESATDLYVSLGFTIRNKFEKPEPKAQVITVEKDGAAFELWQFEDVDHPQVQFIQNHIALYSNDLTADVARFVNKGFKLVIPETDGVTLRYAFVQDSSGLTYEIGTDKS